MPSRIFLLSPARLDGGRAKLLFSPVTMFPTAKALREPEGAELGDVFRFVSGLYFRGKLTYSKAFGSALVITQNRGLLRPETRVSIEDLIAFSKTEIRANEKSFRDPLVRDAHALAETMPYAEIVLLGSIATDKYVDALLDVFGTRLLFPKDFVGRGDMSRGALMLRAVDANRELDMIPVSGASLHGRRAPKLQPKRSR